MERRGLSHSAKNFFAVAASVPSIFRRACRFPQHFRSPALAQRPVRIELHLRFHSVLKMPDTSTPSNQWLRVSRLSLGRDVVTGTGEQLLDSLTAWPKMGGLVSRDEGGRSGDWPLLGIKIVAFRYL